MKTRIHRRSFLTGAQGAMIWLPLLEAMGCARQQKSSGLGQDATPARSAKQALGTGPQRFIVFFSPNGVLHEAWEPTGGETNFEFKRATDPAAKHVLSPLDPIKQKLIVLDGINVNTRGIGPGTNGHDLGMGHMLAAMPLLEGPGGSGEFGHLSDGSAGGITIDQEVANLIGGATRFRSIELGVRSNLDPVRQLTSRMSYRGPFQVVHPENDPRQAFKNLFAGIAPSGQSQPADLDALALRRKSVLDKTSSDLTDLTRKVSAYDRQKLEAHLTAVRELESSLNLAIPPVTCAVPAEGPNTEPQPSANFPTIGQQQMDILALAVACDVSRVLSLQWSTAQSDQRHSWLGISGGHHDISHRVDDEPAARQQMIDIHYWYSEQFLYLVNKLSAIDEMGQSALDNSITMWVNEQGDAQPHSPDRVPYLLAGTGGGLLRPGRYVKYQDASHNDLYLSLLHAFGSNATVFGLPDVSRGPLASLT